MTRRYLIYMVLATAAIAAEPVDPAGWTDAKWGMTLDQVRAAIPDAVPLAGPEDPRRFGPTPQDVSPLGIKKLPLGNDPFAVYFLFDADGKLSSVEFRSLEPDAFAFTRVEMLLTEKYGRPMERKTGNNLSAQWSFPATLIRIQYLYVPGIYPVKPLHLLDFSYSRPKATRL